jgi:hypothetical protein
LTSTNSESSMPVPNPPAPLKAVRQNLDQYLVLNTYH